MSNKQSQQRIEDVCYCPCAPIILPPPCSLLGAAANLQRDSEIVSNPLIRI